MPYLAEFARPRGARDKKKRKSRGSSIAQMIGLGAGAAAGSAAAGGFVGGYMGREKERKWLDSSSGQRHLLWQRNRKAGIKAGQNISNLNDPRLKKALEIEGNLRKSYLNRATQRGIIGGAKTGLALGILGAGVGTAAALAYKRRKEYESSLRGRVDSLKQRAGSLKERAMDTLGF
jgi:hypothetical protein